MDKVQFATFLKLKTAYESEYAPLIAEGKMSEQEAYAVMSEKYEQIIKAGEERKKLMREKSRSILERMNVGDVVSTKKGDTTLEGILIAVHYEDDHISMDDGEEVHKVPINGIEVIVQGDAIEVNDQVEMRPEDTHVYYKGVVLSIDATTGALDVRMDGEDPDDIEKGVPLNMVRKIKTHRNLACMRWNKAHKGIQVRHYYVHRVEKNRLRASPTRHGCPSTIINCHQPLTPLYTFSTHAYPRRLAP
jgi:hypothetical protein